MQKVTNYHIVSEFSISRSTHNLSGLNLRKFGNCFTVKLSKRQIHTGVSSMRWSVFLGDPTTLEPTLTLSRLHVHKPWFLPVSYDLAVDGPQAKGRLNWAGMVTGIQTAQAFRFTGQFKF